MTAILRIVNVVIADSSDIAVTFTEELTSNLLPTNVSILSQTDNVPDSQVLQVTVSGNMFSIICQPLTPYAAYILQFQSVLLILLFRSMAMLKFLQMAFLTDI